MTENDNSLWLYLEDATSSDTGTASNQHRCCFCQDLVAEFDLESHIRQHKNHKPYCCTASCNGGSCSERFYDVEGYFIHALQEGHLPWKFSCRAYHHAVQIVKVHDSDLEKACDDALAKSTCIHRSEPSLCHNYYNTQLMADTEVYVREIGIEDTVESVVRTVCQLEPDTSFNRLAYLLELVGVVKSSLGKRQKRIECQHCNTVRVTSGVKMINFLMDHVLRCIDKPLFKCSLCDEVGQIAALREHGLQSHGHPTSYVNNNSVAITKEELRDAVEHCFPGFLPAIEQVMADGSSVVLGESLQPSAPAMGLHFPYSVTTESKAAATHNATLLPSPVVVLPSPVATTSESLTPDFTDSRQMQQVQHVLEYPYVGFSDGLEFDSYVVPAEQQVLMPRNHINENPRSTAGVLTPTYVRTLPAEQYLARTQSQQYTSQPEQQVVGGDMVDRLLNKAVKQLISIMGFKTDSTLVSNITCHECGQIVAAIIPCLADHVLWHLQIPLYVCRFAQCRFASAAQQDVIAHQKREHVLHDFERTDTVGLNPQVAVWPTQLNMTLINCFCKSR